MYTTTDLIVAILFAIYAFDGLRKGLFRSLISPLAFGICLIVGVLNFDLEQNFGKALLITTAGTLILSTSVKVMLFFSRRTVDKKYRNYVFWGSRFAGAVMSVFWKGGMTALGLLILANLPATTPGMRELQNNIHSSQSYGFISQQVVTPESRIHKIIATMEVLKDPSRYEELGQTPEMQEFFRSPKVTSMVNDPSVTVAIENKDYLQLLSNSNVMAVLSDDHLMGQLSRLSKKLYTITNSTPPGGSSKP